MVIYCFSGFVKEVDYSIKLESIKKPNVNIWFYKNDENMLGFTGEIVVSKFSKDSEFLCLKNYVQSIIGNDIELSDSFECFSVGAKY